jgi:hypothetical protein
MRQPPWQIGDPPFGWTALPGRESHTVAATTSLNGAALVSGRYSLR